MARAQLKFLTQGEIRRIHETSLRILSEVGVVMRSESATRLLLDHGCNRSKDGMRILMPENIVKAALSSAPKSILLASRDGKHDVRIPSADRLYVSCGGEGVYVKDIVTGERHTPSSEDVANFMTLCEITDQIDFCWSLVGAQDQPPELKGIVEVKIGYERSAKHIQTAAADLQEARNILRLSYVLTGGPESFRKRPIFSAVQCPISPLTFEQGLAEAQIELARAGAPVVAMVAAVAGMTSPVTLAGTLAQVNAENLASLVLTQAAAKGAPWIYSSDSCPGDLKSGSIDYGALETHLLRTGAGELGRHYGLPTMTAGIGLEETSLMLGRVRDGLPYMILQGMVPSDLGSGIGGIDQAAGASYEQFLVDAWVWGTAKEAIRDFETDDDAISFETIREAAIDGNFLGKRHTLARFKKEFVAVRNPEAVFSGRSDSEPRGSLVKKAREEVRKLLASEHPIKVTKDEAHELDMILREMR
ncbi:MAG: trimethylamine methyltransferase family protein [Thermoplasmata archaeon]